MIQASDELDWCLYQRSNAINLPGSIFLQQFLCLPSKNGALIFPEVQGTIDKFKKVISKCTLEKNHPSPAVERPLQLELGARTGPVRHLGEWLHLQSLHLE